MEQSHYVTDWLDKRSRLTPDRVGLVVYATGEEITFRSWNTRVNRTARYLQSLGLVKGDRLAVYSGNNAEYVDLYFAAGKLGIIVQNLNWRLTVHELEGIVADGEPKVLVYSPEWAESVDALRSTFTTIEHVVAMIGDPGDDRSFSERDGFEGNPVARPEMSMDDPWGIYYTGGTTGLPKGAILTHGNITWNSVNTTSSWGLHGSHVAPLQLPFFHVGGPNIFLMPLVHTGGKTILCEGFELDETFDLIESGGITHYVAVPTMYQMMQAHPRWEDADFSRLELVISGGAPCPLPIMEKFWERGIDFKMGYGLTEAAGNNFWLPPEDVVRKTTSVGHPLFHIDMKVIAEDGTELGDGEEGELLIRGPHVTPGYWNRPDATEKTIVDGWLHTGDIARRDDEGFYTVIGRSKDMYISGGENVYPAEIESVLCSHAGVAEAAVIGIPEETWGEIGKAFVVLTPDSNLDEASLLAYLAERIAKYKVPRSVAFIEELPKTVIGKIDKKVLIAGEGGGS